MLRIASHDVVVQRLAADQHSVVSARQLRRLGIDAAWVARRVAAGLMRPILPGIYVVGPASNAVRLDTWRAGAVLSCASVGALCLESAAERHGVWDRADGTIHVRTSVRRADHVDPDIHFARMRSLTSDEVLVLDGIATTTIVRTVLDLGMQLTAFQIAHVIHEAVFQRLLDVDELELRAIDRFGRPGSAVVRRAIALYRQGSAGTRSRTEDRLLEEWLRRGFPEPRVNDPTSIDCAGIEPDFVFLDRRLIVEVDGDAGHQRPGQAARDIARDDMTGRHGWRTLRLPASRVWSDLDWCIARIRREW